MSVAHGYSYSTNFFLNPSDDEGVLKPLVLLVGSIYRSISTTIAFLHHYHYYHDYDIVIDQ